MTKSTFKIGQVVGFKSDVEQYGRIVAIKGEYLVLENPNGFDGEYIRGRTITEQHVSDVWEN